MWMEKKGELFENTEGEKDVEGYECDGRHGDNELLWTVPVKRGIVLPDGEVFYDEDKEEKENGSVEKKEFGRREKEQENVNNVAEEMPEDVEDDEGVNNGMDVEDVEDDIEINPEDEERGRANVDFAVREIPEDVEDDEDDYDAYCERDYNGMEYDEVVTDPEEEERGRAVNNEDFDEAMEEEKEDDQEEDEEDGTVEEESGEEAHEDETSSEYQQLHLKMNGFVERLQKIKAEYPELFNSYIEQKLRDMNDLETLKVYARIAAIICEAGKISRKHPEFSEFFQEHYELFKPLEQVNGSEKEAQEQHENIPEGSQHRQEPSMTSENACDSDDVPMEIDEDTRVSVDNSEVVEAPEVTENVDQPDQHQQDEEEKDYDKEEENDEEESDDDDEMSEDYGVNLKDTEDVVDLEQDLEGFPEVVHGEFWYKVNVSEEADDVNGNESEDVDDQSESSSEDDEGSDDEVMEVPQPLEDVNEREKEAEEQHEDIHRQETTTTSENAETLEDPKKLAEDINKNNNGRKDSDDVPMENSEVEQNVDQSGQHQLSQKDSFEQSTPPGEVSPQVVHTEKQVEDHGTSSETSGDVAEHVHLNSLKSKKNEKKRSRSSLSEEDVKIIKKMVKEEVKLRFDQQFSNIGDLFIRLGNALKGNSGTSSSEGQNSGDVPEKDTEDREMRED